MMNGCNKTIVGLGEVLWDLYDDCRLLGGAVANVVHHLNRIGCPGLLVSAVGNDDLGKELLKELSEKGLRLDYVAADPAHPTGTVRVRLDEKKIPQFTCTENAAFDHIEMTEGLRALAEKTDYVIFGTFAQRSEVSHKTLLEFVRAAKNATVICDINLRGKKEGRKPLILKSVEIADILKANEEEFEELKEVFGKNGMKSDEFAHFLIRNHGIGTVLISEGAGGCTGITESETVHVPACKTVLADTTGAGDAFIAAYTVKLISEAPLRARIEFANRVAGFVCSVVGAAPDYTEDEIYKFEIK